MIRFLIPFCPRYKGWVKEEGKRQSCCKGLLREDYIMGDGVVQPHEPMFSSKLSLLLAAFAAGLDSRGYGSFQDETTAVSW